MKKFSAVVFSLLFVLALPLFGQMRGLVPQVIPQVVVGWDGVPNAPGSVMWRTLLHLSRDMEGEEIVKIRSRGYDGSPVPLRTSYFIQGEGNKNEVASELSLGISRTRVVEFIGMSSPERVSAWIEVEGNVMATALICSERWPEGVSAEGFARLENAVSFSAKSPAARWVVPLTSTPTTTTGLSVVNTGTETAEVFFDVFSSRSANPESPVFSGSEILPAGHKLVGTVEQLFRLPFDGFGNWLTEGQVVIRSSKPALVVGAVRMDTDISTNRVVMSSIP